MVFKGWYPDSGCTQPAGSLSSYIANADVTLYAGYKTQAEAESEKAAAEKAAAQNAHAANGTAVGKGAGSVTAEKAILRSKSKEGPSGTVYSVLRVKLKKAGGNRISISWTKARGATRYVVYGAKYSGKIKKLGETKDSSWTQKGLKKGTYCRYIVTALKNDAVVSTSKTLYAATTGGKYTNPKKVSTQKRALKVKRGKTVKIQSAKVKKASSRLKMKTYRKLKYASSNRKIATVSAKGKVKGLGKGTCYVYVYAQSGISARVKITVK